MYESRRHPPLSRRKFARRFALHLLSVLGLFAVSLAGGMIGYARYEHLAWRDAFLNAAMLLGGMGPVDMPQTPGGKVFAGTYALYSGIVFLIAMGLVLAPIVHRVLHKFHWDEGAKG